MVLAEGAADAVAEPLIIAIDGPSGVGKSTVAGLVADRLGIPKLDTGAMYRAVALEVLDRDLDPDDRSAVESVAHDVEIDLQPDADGRLEVYLRGEPVGDRIRHHRVSDATSRVSTVSAVRRLMVDLQRRIARRQGAVIEGRDIGTVVFPETPYKFFLKARADVRADRRHHELKARGETVDRERLLRDIEERDRRDRERKDSPLRVDDSYRIIDTSDIGIDEVVEQLLAAVVRGDEKSPVDRKTPEENPHEITRLLDSWAAGESEAFNRLWPLITADLRNLARRAMAGEGAGHTLETTALIDEVVVRLLGRRSLHWDNRAQFFQTIADFMRHVLVDHARRRIAAKRGGGAPRLSFDEALQESEEPSPEAPRWLVQARPEELLALDDALRDLASFDPELSRIVGLKFFVGLTEQEIADMDGVHRRTISRHWKRARMWLLRTLDHRQDDAQ